MKREPLDEAEPMEWSMRDDQSVIGFPDDLRQWMDERTLVGFALDAVQAVMDRPNELSGTHLPAGRPRVLLSLLSYSYALGLFGSEEIATHISTDPELRYLSANTEPGANELRHFRRYHRSVVQRTMSRLLERVWISRLDPETARAGDRYMIDPLIDQAAEQRINQAVMADTMALDN